MNLVQFKSKLMLRMVREIEVGMAMERGSQSWSLQGISILIIFFRDDKDFLSLSMKEKIFFSPFFLSPQEKISSLHPWEKIFFLYFMNTI